MGPSPGVPDGIAGLAEASAESLGGRPRGPSSARSTFVWVISPKTFGGGPEGSGGPERRTPISARRSAIVPGAKVQDGSKRRSAAPCASSPIKSRRRPSRTLPTPQSTSPKTPDARKVPQAPAWAKASTNVRSPAARNTGTARSIPRSATAKAARRTPVSRRRRCRSGRSKRWAAGPGGRRGSGPHSPGCRWWQPPGGRRPRRR